MVFSFRVKNLLPYIYVYLPRKPPVPFYILTKYSYLTLYLFFMSPLSDTRERQALSILGKNQQCPVIIDYDTTSSHGFTHVDCLCCYYYLSFLLPTFFTTTCSMPDVIVQSHVISRSLTVNTRTTDQPQDNHKTTRGIQSFNYRLQSFNYRPYRITSWLLMVYYIAV